MYAFFFPKSEAEFGTVSSLTTVRAFLPMRYKDVFSSLYRTDLARHKPSMKGGGGG